MLRRFLTIFCIVSTLCLGTSLAATVTTTAPVAFVYVASNYTANHARIVGYAAASDGKLTPTPYSPYSHNVYNMAVNGKYLFASGYGNDINIYPNIYSFSIGPNGYLTLVDTKDVQKFPGGSSCASPGAMVLDHTGATLYPAIFNSDCNDNDTYFSLGIAKSTGALTYLSQTSTTNIGDYVPLIFIGNNELAYSVTSGMYGGISGFRRESNGSLVDISIDVPFVNGSDGNSYGFQTASADPTNHLAVALISDTGTWQIASYTADESNGNLTTTSTYENMPKVSVAGVRNNVAGVLTTSMAPSGKLLAVGGTTGLQIFHFNGADPLTVDTGALTSDEIDYAYWDNDNHLYAISTSAGKLFVFTITPTSATQATGSPYTVTQPVSLIVQPK